MKQFLFLAGPSPFFHCLGEKLVTILDMREAFESLCNRKQGWGGSLWRGHCFGVEKTHDSCLLALVRPLPCLKPITDSPWLLEQSPVLRIPSWLIRSSVIWLCPSLQAQLPQLQALWTQYMLSTSWSLNLQRLLRCPSSLSHLVHSLFFVTQLLTAWKPPHPWSRLKGGFSLLQLSSKAWTPPSPSALWPGSTQKDKIQFPASLVLDLARGLV